MEIAALINNRRYAQKFWQKFRRHDADYYQIETLTICDFLFHPAVKGNPDQRVRSAHDQDSLRRGKVAMLFDSANRIYPEAIVAIAARSNYTREL